jgi:hypothetical protein
LYNTYYILIFVKNLNMTKNHYVVTNPEEGWDCVAGIYIAVSEEAVAVQLAKEYGQELDEDEAESWVEERGYVIHQTSVKEI